MIHPKPKRLIDSLAYDEKSDTTNVASVLDMVGSGKRVLEFGCANGPLSRSLAAAGNRVTALEMDERAAAEARSSCDEVVVADFDVRPLAEVVPQRHFDVAVFVNVLERLRDPQRVLEETRPFLGPGGYAVLAVPNVAHGTIRLALLRGQFEADAGGSFERPTLRFFTLKSVQELCFRAGFRIVELERVKAPLVAPEPAQLVRSGDFEREIVREIEADPEHDTVQFVIRAAPLGDAERLKALVDIAVEAELRSNDALGAVARLEREAQAALARFVELEAFATRESAERSRAAGDLAALQGRFERAQFDLAEANARLGRMLDVERALAATAEQVVVGAARAEAVAEQLELADARAAGYELRSEALRVESAGLTAEVAALRAALERANEEAAESAAAADRARSAFEAEIARLADAVSGWQRREAAARGMLDDANAERDRAVAAQVAAEDGRRAIQDELVATKSVAEQRGEALEDLRFELEREATKLRDVVADRERIRQAKEAQQSAAAAFFTHVEAELARTRREIQHVDGMIRDVQSSRWWTAKRALAKARRIVAKRLRR